MLKMCDKRLVIGVILVLGVLAVFGGYELLHELTSVDPAPTKKQQNDAGKDAITIGTRVPGLEPLAIPDGTVITIRLAQPVGLRIGETKRTFAGALSRSVQIPGKSAIPAGASVSGILEDVGPLDRSSGTTRLEMKITSIAFNGIDYPVETIPRIFTLQSNSKRGASLTGGAAIGGILGALAGRKGAAIGAGAGATGLTFKRHNEILFPVESRLSFKFTRFPKMAIRQDLNNGSMWHLVSEGECLSEIAEEYYGRQDWQKIYRANADSIEDPDVIYPNQILVIPR